MDILEKIEELTRKITELNIERQQLKAVVFRDFIDDFLYRNFEYDDESNVFFDYEMFVKMVETNCNDFIFNIDFLKFYLLFEIEFEIICICGKNLVKGLKLK